MHGIIYVFRTSDPDGWKNENFHFTLESAELEMKKFMKNKTRGRDLSPESQQELKWKQGDTHTWISTNSLRGRWKCTIKLIFTEDVHPNEIENKKLKTEIENMKEETGKLKRTIEELKYFPGGPGYLEALAEWNSRISV